MEWSIRFDSTLVEELRRDVQSFERDENEEIVFNDRRLATINGMIIEIFSNEHPPPHFRVKYNGRTADFRIADCEQISGETIRFLSNLKRWWRANKTNIIDAWNNSRPSDCPVGEYQEEQPE